MSNLLSFSFLSLAVTAMPIYLAAQPKCPVVGDSVTLVGQVSMFQVKDLKMPSLTRRNFPNNAQLMCIIVKPYIGAGVGRVDRIVGSIAHIWLASPKQRDASGNIDWKMAGDPIPTVTFVSVTGKITAQGANILADPTEENPYDIVVEVEQIKSVDAEINTALKTWHDECQSWIDGQISPAVSATWKNPPKEGATPKIFRYDVNPFMSMNGNAAPRCAAVVQYDAKDGSYLPLELVRPGQGK